MTVPAAIRATIQAALCALSKHGGALSDPLPIGRVLRLNDPAAAGSGETIRVLAGHANGYFLDYFRVTADVSSHGRIHEDGRVEKLENYEGQFGITVSAAPGATERERVRVAAHNAEVRAILRQKGLEP